MKITCGRLGVFNDAVIAIIVTVMALELPVRFVDGTLQLQMLLEAIGIYFISFSIAASYWYELAILLEGDDPLSQKAILLNILMLFGMSLLPTLTKAMFEDVEWQTVVLFGLVLSMINIIYYALQVMVITMKEKKHHIPQPLIEFYRRLFIRHGALLVLLYIIGLCAACVFPRVVLVLYVVISLGGFFFNKTDEKGVMRLLKLPHALMKKYMELPEETRKELENMLKDQMSRHDWEKEEETALEEEPALSVSTNKQEDALLTACKINAQEYGMLCRYGKELTRKHA